ncbi:ABC transporter substrate-binding protein [Micromonospora sp. LOL_023]|uniref:ABC transporter substrate-binding protein n=1 Tax=Micromonospora sp. LOL_023 TaxID=3345418 RepID=UPI003A865A6C
MRRLGHPGVDVSRREALRLAGLAGLALGLSACGRFGGGDDPGDDGQIPLNFVWWGDITRAEKTAAALDVFRQHNPGIVLTTEYQDAFPYRDKLNTRFAAGDPPDVMAMRNDSIGEYASRGALLDLTQHDIVDLSGMADSVRKLGTVDGKVVGVPAGLNAQGFVINKTIADRLGVAIPDGSTWSWDDLASFAKQITEASGGEIYGVSFETFNMGNVIPWATQRGENFFTADGDLGASQESIASWLAFIERMRAEGGFPPAGFYDQTAGSAPDKSDLALGKVAAQVVPSNQFLVFNEAVPDGELVLLEYPGETTEQRRGVTPGCPHLWSISADTEHPEESLKLIDFLINDVAGARLTGTIRGVPASSAVTEAIRSTLEPEDQTATDFMLNMQRHEDLPAPPVFPPGGAKLNTIMQTLAAEVEFQKKTPNEAAAAFIDQARDALAG